MTTESPGNMMVLAVNIVGNRAANGHIFGPRRDREEKAAWNGKLEYLRQGNAGLAAEHPRLRIEVQQFIQASRREKRAVIEQTDIAIASALADRQDLGSRAFGAENRSSNRAVSGRSPGWDSVPRTQIQAGNLP